MLITKTNPTGIDNAIQKLQTQIHTQLLSKWMIDTSKYECYGRCYRNKKDGGYVAEIFTGGIEYKDLYWDDTLYAKSFFGVADKVEESLGQGKANVHLVFFVNLKSLKPSILHRTDEEVRQDVISSIGTHSFGFTLTGYETGIENVLREYPVSRDALKDLQPVHSFRINLQVIYKNNNC